MALYRNKGIRSGMDEKKIRLIGDIDALVLEKLGPEATGGESFSRVCPQLPFMDEKNLKSMLLYVDSMTEKDPELCVLYLKNKVFSLCPIPKEEAMRRLVENRAAEIGKTSETGKNIFTQFKSIIFAPSDESSRTQSDQKSSSEESRQATLTTKKTNKPTPVSGMIR